MNNILEKLQIVDQRINNHRSIIKTYRRTLQTRKSRLASGWYWSWPNMDRCREKEHEKIMDASLEIILSRRNEQIDVHESRINIQPNQNPQPSHQYLLDEIFCWMIDGNTIRFLVARLWPWTPYFSHDVDSQNCDYCLASKLLKYVNILEIIISIDLYTCSSLFLVSRLRL